jgi:hypothetical protein
MKLREIGLALRNVLIGANLTSVTMLDRPREMVNYVNECLFLRRCVRPHGDLPQRQVWDTLGSTAAIPVTIYAEAAADWFGPFASRGVDLLGLCMLCQLIRPRSIFEIGTLRGSSALHLASNAPQAEVYTLDLPPGGSPTLPTTVIDRWYIKLGAQTPRMLFEGRAEQARIHTLYGDSAQFDFSPFAGRVDLFFIDAAHSYQYLRNDTEKALACCRPGGVIAWHDYGHVGLNGVSRWLHEFAHTGRHLYRVPGGSLAYMVA